MLISRRTAIRGIIASLGTECLAGCALGRDIRPPYGWRVDGFKRRKVFVRGADSRTVVLLHELPGMSPGCIDFGSELTFRGFEVHMPLLFGHPAQESMVLGTIESCVFGGFHCLSQPEDNDTVPVLWLQQYVRNLIEREGKKSIAVIGMCETGAYPLATMQKNGGVKAAVMSQPALPFSRKLQCSVGITSRTLQRAKDSGVPILGLRFKHDRISTHERFEFLKGFFKDQFECHELDGPPGFSGTWTHPLHAVLTGPWGEIRDKARSMVVDFLESKIG